MPQQVNLHDTKGGDWDKLADDYVKMTTGATNKPCEALLEHANTLLPFSKATSILDNGCGPGPVMGRLLSTFGKEIPESCELTCADFSDGMIAGCQKQKDAAPAESAWKRVELKVQDAMNLEAIASESRSHVLAGFVYFMTQDPAKCLSESRRVLKEGGVLSLSSWEGSEWIDVMNLVMVVRPDKIMPTLRKDWSNVDLLGEELKKAGFKDVEAVRVPTTMSITSYEDTTTMFTEKMPHIAMLMKDASDEDKAKLRTISIEKLKELVPNVPGDLKGMALVAAGRK